MSIQEVVQVRLLSVMVIFSAVISAGQFILSNTLMRVFSCHYAVHILLRICLLLKGYKYAEAERANLERVDPANLNFAASTAPMPATLRVAIITAGSLRSFVFVAKSWRDNLFGDKYPNVVDIFAHVVLNLNTRKGRQRHSQCPFEVEGLKELQSIATEIEVSSPAPLDSEDTIRKEVPLSHFIRDAEYWTLLTTPMKGNVVDMYSRRSRAYQMAKSYSRRHSITYDLFVLLRLDSAFYTSDLNYIQWYFLLRTCNGTESNNAIIPRRVLLTPDGCDFGGVCDRMAVGLEAVMDIYFQPNWPFKVLQWSVLTKGFINQENSIRSYIQKRNSLSENLLFGWLLLNNITQIILRPNKISFITLRTIYGGKYCSVSREAFVSDEGVFWADRAMSFYYHGEPLGGNDSATSTDVRCGPVYQKFSNTTAICLAYASCGCEKEVYKG